MPSDAQASTQASLRGVAHEPACVRHERTDVTGDGKGESARKRCTLSSAHSQPRATRTRLRTWTSRDACRHMSLHTAQQRPDGCRRARKCRRPARTALGQSPELAARICAARSGRAATRMARIPLNATPLPTNESAGHPCQFTMSARWRRYGARAQAFRVHRRRDPCRSGGANKPNSLLINPQSVRREQKVGALGATQAASRRARCARDRR